MFYVDFEKSRCLELLECIAEGRDFPTPAEGWNQTAMMRMAGTCLFAILSHGPPQWSNMEKFEVLPEEHKEATWETLIEDVKESLELYSMLTQKVCDGNYDDECEERVVAIVGRDEDGNTAIKTVEGRK